MKLPAGYRLDRTEPDIWTLIGPGGEVVARFVSGASERVAWMDHNEDSE